MSIDNQIALRLIPMTVEMSANMDRTAEFEKAFAVQLSHDQLMQLGSAVDQSLSFYARIGATDPWIGYLVASAADSTVRGCCGFKGNPDTEGSIEISYHTLAEYENQGYGTATAAAMVNLARSGGAKIVIAHTLPEHNASGRLLQKNGFENIGTFEDPDDGEVWRWRLLL